MYDPLFFDILYRKYKDTIISHSDQQTKSIFIAEIRYNELHFDTADKLHFKKETNIYEFLSKPLKKRFFTAESSNKVIQRDSFALAEVKIPRSQFSALSGYNNTKVVNKPK